MGDVRYIALGPSTLLFNSPYLQELESCNNIIDNPQLLKESLEEKGYLFIRELHDREEVLRAREAVLEYLYTRDKDRLDSAHCWKDGILNRMTAATPLPFMEGRNELTHGAEVLSVLEGPRIKAIFRKLFDKEPKTFDYKWLRAMHHTGFTGAHVDNVYMSRGTKELLTCWTPIGDVTMEMGTLAICEGSHRLPGFRRFQDTYGNLDVDSANLKGTGWFTLDPQEITRRFGGQWKTADFNAGDALIFTMRTVHMSSINTTHFARISCDTRWLPASQQADPRYVGDFKPPTKGQYGVYGTNTREYRDDQVTMEEMKRKWGFA